MRRRLLAALVIGLLGTLAVLATAPSFGIMWDEATYIRSARRYMSWLDTARSDPAVAFSKPVLTQSWGSQAARGDAAGALGDLHPPLVKLAGGLTWRLLRGPLGDLVAYRVAPALFFGLLLAVLYLWVSEIGGQTAGLAAALCLATLPRFYAYAHALALDAPLATLFVVATYVYWKTIDRPGLRWAVPFGLVLAMALATKNGGWLLPLGLGVWTLLFYRTRQHVVRLALSGAIGVIGFFVTWPWLYYDTLARLRMFVRYFFLSHADLLDMPSYYLGRMWQQTPWHYPLVITATVTPLLILLLMAGGLSLVWRDGRQQRACCPQTAAAGWLLVLSAAGPMLPFLLAVTTGYDGERLFLPAFPFLAALAGLAFARLSAALWGALWRVAPRLAARRWSGGLRLAVTGCLLALVCAPGVVAAVHLHPYQLAYYNELVGGAQGAAQRGFETTYWADSYVGLLDYLNENMTAGQSVWAEGHNVFLVYQELGRLRKDIVIINSNITKPDAGDWAIVQARQSRMSPRVVALMQAYRPVHALSVDGVPLVMVYRLK